MLTSPDSMTKNATSTGEEDQSPTDPALVRRQLMRRLILIGVLVNTTLFFRGCSMSDTNFTAGFPLPAVEYRQDLSQRSWAAREIHWLPKPMMLNGLGFVAFAGLAYFLVPLGHLILRRQTAVAIAITFLAFNCVIVSPTIWLHTTFAMESSLAEWVLGDERRVWVMDVFSRAYFVTFVFSTALLSSASQYVWRRYISTPGAAPWQIQLVGIFVLTTLAALFTTLVIVAAR